MAIYLNNVGGTIELVSGNAPARIYYGGGGTSGNFKPADVSRAGELNGFLIDLGGDNYSVKFDDLVINGYSPTTLEFASEALQALFSQTPYTPPPLILEYDIAGNIPYTTLEDWNSFFDLPTYGLPFTSVEIQGRSVYLRGGKGIEVASNLFNGDTTLLSVSDGAYCITSAESSAFFGCSNLITVSMPSLQTAGDLCFRGCTSITSFYLLSLQNAGGECFRDCTSMTSFYLPSLQNAGESGCFQSCTSATSFNLPLLQSASNSCFGGCASVTSFNLPLLEIAGVKCFGFCSDAITFDLPLLQSAGASCFQGCTSATSFNLPLLEITDNECFYNCTSTTSFDFPSLKYINGAGCFNSCLSATSFYLPSVINLGESVESNNVFKSIVGNTISLTIPSALMTCNAGEPDGDIVDLQTYNTVTINLV